MIGLGIGINYSRVLASIDTQAQAFITAAGITDPTQITAINNLVVGLKGASLWDKIIALWPFVGGSATSHKFNLKNPLDTDAAFRLAFSGGFTHNANGITPNGVNGFADTFLSGANLTNNNTSWSIYSRSDITDDNIDIGGANGGGKGIYCFTKRSAGNGGMNSFLYEVNLQYSAMPASTKLIGASRTSNVLNKSYRDGVTLATNVNANVFDITTLATKIVLCAYRAGVGGTPILYSSRNLASAHIGLGFSDAEFAAFNTLIVSFQTTLGRNV